MALKKHSTSLTLVLLLSLVLVACAAARDPRPIPERTQMLQGCRYGAVPDVRCTPGATNPSVSQATIRHTICVRGWTATVRPPVSYTNALKTKQMVVYGLTGHRSLYEEDHFIPLELGGAPRDPHNLWPERWAGATGAHAKDVVENLLHARVCAGTLPLAAAQQQIITDWLAVH